MNARIGLLGGSFNPVHNGHVFIAENAIKRLNLDQLWFLITPQNPFKKEINTLPFKSRVELAKSITSKNNKMKVSEIEKKFSSRETINTIKRLKSIYPEAKFIWIMGIDNATHFHHWRNWEQIIKLIPIVIFNRGSFNYYSLLKSKFLVGYKKFIHFNKNFHEIRLPYIGIMVIKENNESSTRIRSTIKQQLLK